MPWWPQDQWERMVVGDDCPMCTDGHQPTNPYGDLIADLPGSYARLHVNQTQAGYTVLIAKRHAAELYELTTEELHLFWVDVAAVARTISVLFAPVKLDYLVMGHLCPHVHCHLYPQYGDDDPHALIDVQRGSVRLDSAAWRQRVAAVRAELAQQHPAYEP